MNSARTRLDTAATWSGTLGRPAGGPPRTPSWLAPQGIIAQLREESPALVRRPSAPPPPENEYAAAGAQRRLSESVAPPAMPPPPPPEEDLADDLDDALEASAPQAFTAHAEENSAPVEDPRDAVIAALRGSLDEARIARERAEARAQDAETAAARARRDVLAESEAQLLRLALAIAERVVGRELRTDPALVARWAKDAVAALATVASDARPSVAVGLAMAAAVPGDAWSAVLGAGVKVDRDASLPPLGAEVRAGVSVVDVSPAGRLAALRTELLGDLDEAEQ